MSRIRYVLLVITVVALVGVSALALDVPHSFAGGDVISAAEMNANFAAVEAAVSALEASRPVVAHGRSTASNVPVTSTTDAEDVVTVTLDAPGAGVVLVQATGQVAVHGTTDPNFLAFQIDTEEGGTLTGNGDHDFIAGFVVPPGGDTVWMPVAIQRAFEVAAGPQTYRLEAIDLSGFGQKYFWNPTITATWYAADQAEVQLTMASFRSSGATNR